MQEVTYAQLRARASIYTNEMTVSEQEWSIHINDAAKDYWNRINMANQMYNVTKDTFNLVVDKAEYDLPDDFLYVVSADIDKNGTDAENSNNRVSVQFMPLDYRNAYRNNYINSTTNGSVQYGPWSAILLSNTTFLLQPTPTTSSYLFILRYVPYTPTLSEDSSNTINGINGFDVYISQLAAKRVLDSRGQPSMSLDSSVAIFQEYLKSSVVTRNRAMRTPVIDRSIGPYASY